MRFTRPSVITSRRTTKLQAGWRHHCSTSGALWGCQRILVVPLGSLGPRPRPSSPLPLLPRPVGVAELLIQRRDPLVQTGRLLVGNDRKPLVWWTASVGLDGNRTPASTSPATSTTVR